MTRLCVAAGMLVLLVACGGVPNSPTQRPVTSEVSSSFPATLSPTNAGPTARASVVTPSQTATARPSSVVPDPSTVDPCAWIGATRIRAELDVTVKAGIRDDGDQRISCFYAIPRWRPPPDSLEESGVRVMVHRDRKSVDSFVLPFGGDTVKYEFETVPGVGEAASWALQRQDPSADRGTETAALAVVVEPIEFQIMFVHIPAPTGVDRTEWRAAAEALAGEVLARLSR